MHYVTSLVLDTKTEKNCQAKLFIEKLRKVVLIEKTLIFCYMPSSVISAIRYNSDTATLRIIFVSGMVYDYKNVPEDIYKEMKSSESKGAYLNLHIKGYYTFEKIK